MGVDFNALLFYGMPIQGDCDYRLMDAINESGVGLELANLSPMTGSDYMLFVRESYKSGDKNSDEVRVRLSDVTGKEVAWRRSIVDACLKHGLAFSEPDWYFATTFS